MKEKGKGAGLLCLALCTVSAMLGAEWSGYVGAEGRVFENRPAYSGQDGGGSVAIQFEPEFYHEWADGDESIVITPYFRWDSLDEERSLFDLRELSYLRVSRDWEFRIGLSKVFWGVAESQHLVDVINQTDLVSSLDGEDKLGQPMVELTRISRLGDFSLYILPGFRERTFPGVEGRLRGPLPVDTDRPFYESSAGEEHVDGAVRWSNVIGDFDVGLHYFRGTSREPVFQQSLLEGATILVPFYEQMEQVGLDLQYTRDGWLWKLEAIGRDATSARHSAAVGGFEYTFYGISGSSIDAGLLVEAHVDSRGESAPTSFNNDVFVGTRLGWNDEADTSVVAGIFFDWKNQSMATRVEFERRLGQSLKLEIELQEFANVDVGDAFFPLRRDSYVQLALSRYF